MPYSTKMTRGSARDSSNLTLCKDCGEGMSKNAWTCPKCGAPNVACRRKVLLPIALLICLVVIGYFVKEWIGIYYENMRLSEKERLLHEWESSYDSNGKSTMPVAPPGL